jgi:hypothetical protein
MARRPIGPLSRKLVIATLLCAVVAGCGLFAFEQRAAWRGEAEEACLAAKQVSPSAYLQPMRAMSGPGVCGMDHPFRVTAFAEGSVPLTSRAILACPAISATDRWLAEIVQPAAMLYFGSSVAGVNAGSYSCRSMNHQPGAPRSEHSYGNAVDIMSLTLADGRVINVEKGWRGAPEEQEFLREIFVGACRYFSTVLAPGSDRFHYNHIHLDLARHAKGRTICKPILKFTPRIDPDNPVPAESLQAMNGPTDGYARLPPHSDALPPAGPAMSIRQDAEAQPNAAGDIGDDHPGEHDPGGENSVPIPLTPPAPSPATAVYVPQQAPTPTRYLAPPPAPSPPRPWSDGLRPPGLVGRRN